MKPNSPVLPQNGLRQVIKRHNLDIQFFAYEGGNAVAAVAGAGGFRKLSTDVAGLYSAAQDKIGAGLSVFTALGELINQLVAHYPDLTVVRGGPGYSTTLQPC